MLDALLVGTNDALDHDEHRIANLFAMGAGRVRPRDLLIGHHALQLLAQDRHSQPDLHQALRSLGYAETNIGVVEKSLLTFNFLHEEPAGGKKIEYEIHEDVVQEYLALRFEPAYVDNVAMVTPVDPKYLPSMSKTARRPSRGLHPARGHDPGVPRVHPRLRGRLSRPGARRQYAGRGLRPGARVPQARLPLEAHGPAYHDRLLGLRGSGYLRGIEPSWWDATLGNPLFEQARVAGEFLTPGHGL